MNENFLEGSELLTQISEEKFRRKLLIASRILAFFLIVSIFYFAYGNIKYGEFVKEVDNNPCFFCGLHEGKRCVQVYYTEEDKNLGKHPSDIALELAEYNIRVWPKTRELGGVYGDSLSDFLIKYDFLINNTNFSVKN